VTSEDYAEFLRAIGHRVVPAGPFAWFDASRFFFLSAPSHRTYAPTREQLQAALRTLPCLGVRFATPIDGDGKLSYQIVCDDHNFDLDKLSGNTRSKVRRGLKRCRVEPVDFATIASAGRQAHADTVARQGRDGVLAGERWSRFFAAAAKTPGIEGWGAWHDGALAAFLVTVTFDDAVEFLLARSCSDSLGAYPNNALIFEVTYEMMVRRRADQVTFGLESLEPVGPLDQFKLSMGFRQRPLRQCIVFQPALAKLLHRSAVRNLVRRWTERSGEQAVFWRKAAGILRFAEEAGL
jgi:hypothetical protein